MVELAIKAVLRRGMMSRAEKEGGRETRRYPGIYHFFAWPGLAASLAGAVASCLQPNPWGGLIISTPFLALFGWLSWEISTYKVVSDGLGIEVFSIGGELRLSYSQIEDTEFRSTSGYVWLKSPVGKLRLTPMVADFAGLVNQVNQHMKPGVSRYGLYAALEYMNKLAGV